MFKKVLTLLLTLCLVLCLTACKGKDTNSVISSDISQSQSIDDTSSENETVSNNVSSNESTTESESDIPTNSESSTDITIPNSSSEPTTSTTTKPTESSKPASTQNQTSNNDEFSTHPGKNHVFGDETLLLYPTAFREGCYGKRCEQTKYGDTGGIQELCAKVEITKLIPKRAGDYSSIDSSFKVIFSDDDTRYAYGYGERYKMIDELDFSIYDERTQGAVPTIQYNKSEGVITVIVELDHSTLYTHNFDVAQITEYIKEGYMVHGHIKDDGVELYVGTLSGSGG